MKHSIQSHDGSTKTLSEYSLARPHCGFRVGDSARTRWKSKLAVASIDGNFIDVVSSSVQTNYKLVTIKLGTGYATNNHEICLLVHYDGAWQSFATCQEAIPNFGTSCWGWSDEWQRAWNHWRLKHQVPETFQALVSKLHSIWVYWLIFGLCRLPIVWAASIITRARKEGRIRDDFAVKTIIDELNKFRGQCGLLISYDTISIPLVYTQVVTIAVYSYFITGLVSRVRLWAVCCQQ